ncbi:MAG: substrate-binding domain-containing protein [Actinomycetota bacterium]
MRRLTAMLLAAATVTSGCVGDGGDQPILVMVPSSFNDITREVDQRWDGEEIEWIIAGSTQLVRQLDAGADAAVLITADATTMQTAVDAGLIERELGPVATNRLVFAVAPDNPGAIDGLDDLTDPDRLIGVCAIEVPCGRLADAAATALDLTVAADTEEPNVRSLALKIARGELDGGLVYATDASAFGLETIDDGALSGFITEYATASVDGSSPGVVAFLRSEDGRRILAEHGFGAP